MFLDGGVGLNVNIKSLYCVTVDTNVNIPVNVLPLQDTLSNNYPLKVLVPVVHGGV